MLVTVELVSTLPPLCLTLPYTIFIPKGTTPMTANELKALAQDLRNERTEALRKADNAQECLNEVQRKLALLKLQAQCDTPLADYYGG